MIATSDWRQRERFDALSRLDSLVLREADPDAWNRTVLVEAMGILKRWQAIGDFDHEGTTGVFVDLYRLACRARAFRIPQEHFFWLLTTWLHMAAHVGPDAVLHQKEHLGPLWERLEAIRKRHGWPKNDENGDPWSPEDHLDQVPEDYAAWAEEFERVADEMETAAFQAVCEK
ncbi:hypothetical protein LCGC14_2174280, partial [marine sediment metagenome]